MEKVIPVWDILVGDERYVSCYLDKVFTRESVRYYTESTFYHKTQATVGFPIDDGVKEHVRSK